MFSVSPEEKECMRADQQSFHDLSLTQAYIPKACWGLVVRDLKASDFHLFADGKEQTIQGFNLERSNILVRDNLGAHNEFSYTPTAKWSSVDLPHPGPGASVSEAENFFYFYNFAFNPEGGAVKPCHQIRLKVDRPHTLVYYRPEYCLQEMPADLLEGSDLAKQMGRQTSATYRKKNWRDYASKPGAFALEYQIGSLHLGHGTSRVLLSIEFAGGLLRRHWEWHHNWWELQASIAVLGVIRSRDGTEVTRFNGLGCCSDYSTARLFAETGPVFSPLAVKQMAGIAEFRISVRYENACRGRKAQHTGLALWCSPGLKNLKELKEAANHPESLFNLLLTTSRFMRESGKSIIPPAHLLELSKQTADKRVSFREAWSVSFWRVVAVLRGFFRCKLKPPLSPSVVVLPSPLICSWSFSM